MKKFAAILAIVLSASFIPETQAHTVPPASGDSIGQISVPASPLDETIGSRPVSTRASGPSTIGHTVAGLLGFCCIWTIRLRPVRVGSLALLTSVLSFSSAQSATVSEGVGWSDGMYMAYFNINTTTGDLIWTNQGGLTRSQQLRPTTVAFPDTYYASTTAGLANSPSAPDHTVVAAPWAQPLNPTANGGADTPSSRWFGFSLESNLKSYLATNNYALAIQLDSITFKNTSTAAENVEVYYYNNGTNDMNMPGSYHSDLVAWDLLTGWNYLIWDGNDFMNMVHPLVLSKDTFATDYTLNFTLSIVQDITGSASAAVVDSVTGISGLNSLQISYDASTPGVVPEPSTTAMLIGGALLIVGLHQWRIRRQRTA